MKKIELSLVDEICNEQDFDEILLEIGKHKENKEIKEIMQMIDENTDIDDKTKRKIYEGIFEYVNSINENFKIKVKEIYEYAVKETIKKINYGEKGKKNSMKSKIKIIIADDNKVVCNFMEKYLKNYDDIEILGIANTDEEEIDMIEKLKPEIVITDLLRNNKYTGLDIIKKYSENKIAPEFLVISADRKQDIIGDELKVAGYIEKPFENYDIVYANLRKIKKELEHKKYLKWNDEYHNKEIVELKKHFTDEELKIIEKLGVKIKEKIYTEYEFERLNMDLLAYYKDNDMSEEELKQVKNLEDTGVTREQYNNLMEKIETVNGIYHF